MRRTGLSAHVIRIWEKRYNVVTPSRTGTNRRLYTEADIERFQLLQRAIQSGHSIGNIAALPNERLVKLADSLPHTRDVAVTAPKENSGAALIEECIEATRKLDGAQFEATLQRASIRLGNHGLLEQVVAPVAQAIGELWRDGTITAAHEHFASAAIRVFLGHASRPFALPANAPQLVVATPAGQLHELGAVMVAAAATDLGWRVTYLGTSLPAAEIAGSAVQNHARAVALSIVYPGDDEHLPEELEKLRRYLPAGIKIMVGGRAAEKYGEALKRIGAMHAADLRDFCAQLDSLRVMPKRKLQTT